MKLHAYQHGPRKIIRFLATLTSLLHSTTNRSEESAAHHDDERSGGVNAVARDRQTEHRHSLEYEHELEPGRALYIHEEVERQNSWISLVTCLCFFFL